MVYKNCKFYGPYQSKKDKRLRCVLVYSNRYKVTLSYPKYLMEVHLDRYLDKDETVDHIDGDFLNNDISNLQILKRQEHCYKDVIRNEDIEVKCNYCGKLFTIPGNMINNRNRKLPGYFCSKNCSGKYGKDIQLGLRTKEYSHKIIPNKYQVKSAKGGNSLVDVG